MHVAKASLSRTITTILLLLASAVTAADWNPAGYVDEDTIELRTQAPGEDPYWFPVWIVVLDDQAYVRLGSKATERVNENQTGFHLSVRIAGQQFDDIRGEKAPEMTDAVAKAMAEKYWSDVFVRYMSHPLTLRLVPEK